jgi:cytochrome c oxidase subunit IV
MSSLPAPPNVATAKPRTRRPLLRQVATWPPLVYVLLGAFALLFWAGGTAIQVQTSEAWIMGVPLTRFPSIATFGQLWEFAWGRLPASAIVPFSFGWGVQIALIIASVGVELPRHPQWRYLLSWGVIILLIGVNSCGDYLYAQQYGFWGASGFTLVILFVTFCAGLLAIMCFIHAVDRMRVMAQAGASHP